jgi:hypothetical protein
MAGMETRDFHSEVTTPDGRIHSIHIDNRGATWTASGYVGPDFVEGEKANLAETAIENWLLAYKQMRATDN